MGGAPREEEGAGGRAGKDLGEKRWEEEGEEGEQWEIDWHDLAFLHCICGDCRGH